MITHRIPHKARYIPTANNFSSAFTGIYDFAVSANTKQTLLKLDPNIIYYIDNYSIGGNIPKEDYLSAISTLPVMLLSRKHDRQNVYARSIPIAHFYENKEATVFIDSAKSARNLDGSADQDELQISVTGILVQNAALLGITPVIITVSFSIYAIENNDYSRKFIERTGAIQV